MVKYVLESAGKGIIVVMKKRNVCNVVDELCRKCFVNHCYFLLYLEDGKTFFAQSEALTNGSNKNDTSMPVYTEYFIDDDTQNVVP